MGPHELYVWALFVIYGLTLFLFRDSVSAQFTHIGPFSHRSTRRDLHLVFVAVFIARHKGVEAKYESMKYELLYIIPATIADHELSSVEGSVSAILEKHGAQLIESTRLGKLRFAYPINKTRYGHYTLVHFDTEGESMAKIDMELRILNTVLRYIILKQEETSKKPFTLVQFTEVNVDSKESGRRRKKSSTDESEKPSRDDISSGVKAIEGDETEDAKVVVEGKKEEAPIMSDSELEKKLTEVLTKDEKEA